MTIPVRDLRRDGDDRPQHDGVLEYVDADGRDVVLDIEVNVRGKSREELCTYPPLKIDFVRDEVEGTVFAGQNKLKLVTLCERTPEFRAYLAKEFLIYRLFNALTDRSFRVRWAEIDYVDESRKKPDEFSAPAFFIEDDREVADRLGLEVVEREHQLPIADLEPRHTALLALFQYMIGNTDWDIAPAAGEACCHNAKTIAAADGSVILLPYDFDQAGLINTGYAAPSRVLQRYINEVTERLYRGFCRHNDHIDAARALIESHRAALQSLLEHPPIEVRGLDRSTRYLSDSFEYLGDRDDLESAIDRGCR